MSDTFEHGRHPDGAGSAESEEDQPFKRLTREEAQVLREKHPPVSPWRVLAVQAGVGVAVAVLLGLVMQRSGVAWSALYGAATVVLPGAVLARGMTRRTSTTPGAAVLGFLLWEMMKIAFAVALLVAAPKVVPDLSWPALLVAIVVCAKVSWLALLKRRQPVVEETNEKRV